MDDVRTRRLGAIPQALGRWFVRSFSGTEPALCQMALFISAALVGLELNATYWPGLPGGILFALGTLTVMELALFLARWALQKTLGHSLGWLMSLFLLYYVIARNVRRGAGEGWTWRVYLFSALVAAALWVLTAAGWKLLRHRRVTATTALSWPPRNRGGADTKATPARGPGPGAKPSGPGPGPAPSGSGPPGERGRRRGGPASRWR